MPDAKLQFKRGLLSNLPASIVDGTVYVTTDEHAMYIDNGSQRIRLGDFIPVDTVSDLPATGHAYETAVYYVKTGNILARWDATNNRWIQINKAGVVGINDAGQTGNVITGIDIETALDGTLQLRITKASVATNTDFADLLRRVTAAEDDIDNLEDAVGVINGDVNQTGSILNAVNTAKLALLNGATTYTTFKEIEDAIVDLATRTGTVETTLATAVENIADLSSDVEDLSDDLTAEVTARTNADTAEATARQQGDTALGTRIDTVVGTVEGIGTRLGDAEGAITELQSDVSENTAAIATLNGDASTTGSVRKTVNEAIAAVVANAPSDLDTLKEIADWISGHASDAAAMNTAISDLGTRLTGLADRVDTTEDDIDTLETGLGAANTNITNLQSAVNILNGDVNTNGSVDKKINDAINGVNTNLTDLTGRVVALEDAVEVINGDESTEGSIAYAVAAEAALREAADDALDTRIDGLATRMETAEGSISTLSTRMTDVESLAGEAIDRLTWIGF